MMASFGKVIFNSNTVGTAARVWKGLLSHLQFKPQLKTFLFMQGLKCPSKGDGSPGYFTLK